MALNIKPGFDKDMTAGLLQEIQPFKGSVTQSYWASLVANAILLYRACEAANKCVAEELERTSNSMSDSSESATKSTKRGTYEKYTPKEKAKTSCNAWYHSHNKASPYLAKLYSDHEIFYKKINNFANFECFTKFLCLENLELYGMKHQGYPTLLNRNKAIRQLTNLMQLMGDKGKSVLCRSMQQVAHANLSRVYLPPYTCLPVTQQ